MKKNKIYNLIGQCLKIDPSKLKESTSNKNLAIWDSMNHVKIIIQLEKIIGKKISFNDTLKLTSIKKIMIFLKKKDVI